VKWENVITLFVVWYIVKQMFCFFYIMLIKRYLLLFLVGLSFVDVMSQDKIILESAEVIEGKVEMIGVDVIRYRKYSYPQGPLYEVSKKNVLAILYENGTAEVFVANKGMAQATDQYSPQIKENLSDSCSQSLMLCELSNGKLIGRNSGIKLGRKETYRIMECFDVYMARKFRSYSRKARIGSFLLGSGLVLNTIGGAMLCTNKNPYDSGLTYIGSYLLLHGVPSLLVGIPLRASGVSKRKDTVYDFYHKYSLLSSKNSPTLYFYSNGLGVGLNMTF